MREVVSSYGAVHRQAEGDLISGTSTMEALDFYRKLVAGVTIVTARGEDGPVGMTATAVTSVSLRPALLLACLAGDSRTLGAIRREHAFGLHLLADDEPSRPTAFSVSAAAPGGKFRSISWSAVHGVPVLDDVLAWAVCAVVDERKYGDHSIVVGRLVATGQGTGNPLVWHDRSYWALGEEMACTSTRASA